MRVLLLCGGLVLCATSSAFAEQTQRLAAEPAPVSLPARPETVLLDAEASAALQAEVDARIESGRKAARSLTSKALAAAGADRIEFLREVQELNESLTLDILRIQARHTRAAGFDEAADRIEASITARIEARENPSSRVPLQRTRRSRPDGQGGDR